MREIEAGHEAINEALVIETDEEDKEGEEDDVDRKEDARGLELYAVFEKVCQTLGCIMLLVGM
jgi:hypothetical protein